MLIGDTGAPIGQFSFQVSQLPLCEMSQPLMTPVDVLVYSGINEFCLMIIIIIIIKYCSYLLLPLYRVFTIIYLKQIMFPEYIVMQLCSGYNSCCV